MIYGSSAYGTENYGSSGVFQVLGVSIKRMILTTRRFLNSVLSTHGSNVTLTTKNKTTVL